MNGHSTHHVYTSPTKNFLKGLNTLRKALSNGTNARLMRVWNEDCNFPIQQRKRDTPDEYTMSHGSLYSENEIRNGFYGKDPMTLDLTLNYHPLFGEKEAAENYQKTGVLTEGNFKGMGYCHLVKRADIHQYLVDKGETQRAAMYLLPTNPDEKCWIYPAQRKDNSYWQPVIYKHKVWGVVLLDKGETSNFQRWVKILNVLAYPSKFIPRRSVLHMPEYTNHTFRVGSIVHGWAVEIQVPKKFRFKD